MMKVVIASFATIRPPYRNYTERIEKMKRNCERHNLIFELYDVERIQQSSHYNFSNQYFRLKRGVGYWHWKPVVLLDAHELHPKSLIIYIDIDFDLVDLPLPQLQKIVTENYSLGLFRTQIDLIDFSSKSFSSFLEISKETKMMIASIIIANFAAESTSVILKKWMQTNDLPNLLLDPIFELNTKHRHDQSILSYISREWGDYIMFMDEGYWADSKEAWNMKKESAWVIASQEQNLDCMSKREKLVRRIRYYLWIIFNRIQIFRFYHE